MSIAIKPIDLIAQGKPILFWRNRYEIFNVGSETVAYSGKLAIIKTPVSGLKGFPMVVEYRMATRAHIEAWRALADSDPFETTSLADYFDTGYKVIFRQQNPIPSPRNEVIQDFDIFQTLFDTTSADYKKGLNRFRGILNLVITE